MSNRSTPQLLAAVLIALGLFVAVLAPVPYVAFRPGPVFDVLGSSNGKQLVTVSGAPTYPTTGVLDLLTVSEVGGPGGRITLTDVFTGWLDSAQTVLPVERVYPKGATADEVRQQSEADMVDSKDTATVAALKYLGIPVKAFLKVGDVSATGPANAKLRAGDKILAVDGMLVKSPEELRAAIGKHKPGESVAIEVERAGAKQTSTIVTEASKEDSKRPVIGISLATGYESSVKVTIQLDDVGGPSAGLMFTLGIIDKLTKEQETGGLHIAGTGTMALNGEVGPIGGIRQKMAAAKADGAVIFLIPAENCAEALPAVPAGLKLVKVTNLDDALTGLAAATSGSGTFATCG